MTTGMIISLIFLGCAFILVLGLIFALLFNADIIPGLFVAGLCIFAAMIIALPFIHTT